MFQGYVSQSAAIYQWIFQIFPDMFPRVMSGGHRISFSPFSGVEIRPAKKLLFQRAYPVAERSHRRGG